MTSSICIDPYDIIYLGHLKKEEGQI